MAFLGLQNFVQAIEEQQRLKASEMQDGRNYKCDSYPCHSSEQFSGSEMCGQGLTTQAVDAWLLEMGRAAFAASSAPAAFRFLEPRATVRTLDKIHLPDPALDGLKTLSILAKGSIEHLRRKQKQSRPGCSSPSSSPSTNSVAARMYLKALTVHAQLCSGYEESRVKQKAVAKSILEALTSYQEAALHVPTWTVRLLVIAGRLLTSLKQRPQAIALLETYLPLLDASPMAAPLIKAYLWLYYTQLKYYDLGACWDRAFRDQGEAAAHVAVVFRQALLLLNDAREIRRKPRPSSVSTSSTSFNSSPSTSPPCSPMPSPPPSPSSSPSSPVVFFDASWQMEALVATASFRLADLLLSPLSGSSESIEPAAAREALALCRTCLQNAAPLHFRSLRVYLATALRAAGEGGVEEAAAEVEAERARRAGREGGKERSSSSPPLPRSASLLNMRGLENVWLLPEESWWAMCGRFYHNYKEPNPALPASRTSPQQASLPVLRSPQAPEQAPSHSISSSRSPEPCRNLDIPRSEGEGRLEAGKGKVVLQAPAPRPRKDLTIAALLGAARPRPLASPPKLEDGGCGMTSSIDQDMERLTLARGVPPHKRHRTQDQALRAPMGPCAAVSSEAVSANG